MSTLSIVLLVITIILIAGIALLYFLGKKAQKKLRKQEYSLRSKRLEREAPAIADYADLVI